MKTRLLLLLNLLTFLSLAHADTKAPDALNMPRPDRAEVMSVEPGATEGPKTDLSAAKARKVLKLLQGFHWIGPAGACDKLQYVIRFYAKDKLIATDGLCFHCGCFVALDADGSAPITFDLENANAKYLAKYLENFSPTAK